MTVGELKNILKDIPDDLEIVTFESDMEKCGIMKAYISPRVETYRKEIKTTWDRFDGGSYIYEVFEKDENGDVKALRI